MNSELKTNTELKTFPQKITFSYRLAKTEADKLYVEKGLLVGQQEVQIDSPDLTPAARKALLLGVSKYIGEFTQPPTLEDVCNRLVEMHEAAEAAKAETARRKAEAAAAEAAQRERLKAAKEAEEAKEAAEWERRKAEAEAAEQECASWIQALGSKRLKLAFAAGYDVTDLYIQERANLEFPDFEVVDALIINEPEEAPSLEALELAACYQGAKIGVVSTPDDDEDEYLEVIFIPYLGKQLVKYV